MEPEETAILRLRAAGRSYRQIAQQLGIPLTRAYTLAKRAIEPEPELAGFAGQGDETPLPVAPPPLKPDATPPPPGPGIVRLGYLTGPYTMPGPNGTVIVVDGGR